MNIRTALLSLALATIPLEAAATVVMWGPPNSVAVGAKVDFFQATFNDEVVNESWTPIAGVPYRYEIDPSCGAFEGGATTFDGVTNEWGEAKAPAFWGVSVTLSCRTLLFLDGYPDPFDVSVHVFSPDAVVMTVVPPNPDPWINEQYLFEVLMTESGLPVNASPTGGAIGVSPSGSTGTLMYAHFALNSGRAIFSIMANDKQGHYDITITYRDKQVVIPIDQHVRPPRR
jgi:hypothetical protein